MFHRAEQMAPSVAGIRLNIGLVHYRQGDYRAAIPSFESVVRDMPDSLQARYLLGLCYFFTERYADSVTTLEPIWSQESRELNYLYVLGIAAGKAKRGDLEQSALAQLVKIGQNSAEFHLLMGKAHLNREEYDDSIRELELAASADPKLPFVHFNLGMAYVRKQDLERAKAEFQRDIAIEPDVAYDYDQLGTIAYLQQKDNEAAAQLHKALRLDPHLVSAHYQLGRLYQRQGKFTQALAELDVALKADPESYPVHYSRGQVLQKLGRTQDARAEMETVTRMLNESRNQRQKELEEGSLPNPELIQEPQ